MSDTQRRPRVLVVDDTPANLVAMRRLLRSVECELIEASSGNEALARYIEDDYALVLLDVQMPEMDGYEVAQFMREEETKAATPIVFVTAVHDDASHRQMGYEVGAIDYLTKPIDPMILKTKVEVFLELYEARREVEAVKAGLERTVELRTAELRASLMVAERLRSVAEKSRDDAETALARVEEANQVRTRFLSRISHELRTPMNGILGLLQLIDREHLDDAQHECIDGIESSANNLLLTLNEILDFSQTTGGNLEPSQAPFRLMTMLTEVGAAVESMAREKHLGFRVDNQLAGDPVVLGDVDMIRRILLAFGHNAVKFSEHGEVRIRVEGREEEGALSLRIGLIDEGVGIDPEFQETIFEGFSQLDDSSTRESGGVGLGLAIARAMSDAMGAQVRVDSSPNEGSTFWFEHRLPLEHQPEAAEKEAQPASTDVAQAADRPPHVLVAEDNHVNQQVAVGMLKKLGATAVVAGNGLEAVKTSEAEAFDLVLMDLDMPEMDGFDATRAIRRREAESDGDGRVPIIALTANLAAETRKLCLQAGMDEYLGKPVRLEQLKDMLGRFVGLPIAVGRSG